MPNTPEQFAAAVCPQCGGQLKVEPGQKFVECPYCGTISRTVDVHYHQHQNTNYNFSGSNTTVQFNAGQDLETLIKNAETHMKLGNYSDAHTFYTKISKEYPHDYRGWWGLVLSNTKNLSDYTIMTHTNYEGKIESYLSIWECILGYWNNVTLIATGDTLNQLKNKFSAYEYACRKYHARYIDIPGLTDQLSSSEWRLSYAKKKYRVAIVKSVAVGLLALVGVWLCFSPLRYLGFIPLGISLYLFFLDHGSHGKNDSYLECLRRSKATISEESENIPRIKNELKKWNAAYPDLHRIP